MILSPGEKPRQAPAIPAELLLVDLAGPSVVATLPFEVDPKNPVLSPDGKFVYLIEEGKPSGNPEKNVNGRLHVVSLESRKLEVTVDAGSKPRGLVLDEAGQQLLVLSDEPPVKGRERAGDLRVIRGSVVQPPIKVAKNPRFVRAAPKVNRMYVLGENDITTLSLPDFMPLGSTPAKGGFGVDDLVVTADGARGLMLFGGTVNILDLEAGKPMDSIRTGRMSALLINAAVAGTLTELSRRSGEREAARKNQSYYSYTEYSLRDVNPSIALRPDGRFVYFVNNETRDVTIIDVGNATVVDKIGGAGFDIQFLGVGATVAAILADSVVRLLDTTSNKKLGDLTGGDFKKDAGFKRLEVSPDGRYGVAYGAPGVFCLDGSTGQIVGRAHGFKRVVDVAYVW